jgi:hypothetical protein
MLMKGCMNGQTLHVHDFLDYVILRLASSLFQKLSRRDVGLWDFEDCSVRCYWYMAKITRYKCVMMCNDEEDECKCSLRNQESFSSTRWWLIIIIHLWPGHQLHDNTHIVHGQRYGEWWFMLSNNFTLIVCWHNYILWGVRHVAIMIKTITIRFWLGVGVLSVCECRKGDGILEDNWNTI